jgi:hypothetical protein
MRNFVLGFWTMAWVIALWDKPWWQVAGADLFSFVAMKLHEEYRD